MTKRVFPSLWITMALFLIATIARAATSNNGTSERPHRATSSTEIARDNIKPLPEGPIQRFHIDRNGGRVIHGNTAGATGTLVYRNTLGANFFAPGADTQVADDILTIASGGCDLSFLEVLVTGGGNGSGPGFDATFALLTACPGMGGTVIDGTTLTGIFPNNGAWHVTLDLEGMEVEVSQNPWLQMSFSNATAGWVFGRQAEVGFTENLFHHPQFPCNTIFQGGVPYSGFYAEIWCGGDVEAQFEAYRADEFSGFVDTLSPNDLWADDIKPITSPGQCEFVRYDSDIAGLMGNFSMKIELYTNDATDTKPLAPIMGTSQVCNGLGGGANTTCTKSVFPSITIPTADFWITYDLLAGEQGGPLLVADFPAIGHSLDGFSIFGNPAPGQWSPPVWWYGGCPDMDGTGDPVPCGTFKNIVYCADPEPRGACCDVVSENPQDCTDDVAFSNCNNGRWINATSCTNAVFDPQCGTASCCKLDGNCENLTLGACEAESGLWQPGQFCNEVNQSCPPVACLAAENLCDEENNNDGGCSNVECCAIVCSVDSFCCHTAWDSSCVGIAISDCDELFPPGSCCLPNEVCVTTKEPMCASAMWTEGQPCDPNPCLYVGACCYIDGACDETYAPDCDGESWAAQETCENVTCPLLGSCCNNGNCQVSNASNCTNGVWTFGQACTPNPCPPVGSCCDENGFCATTTALGCSTGSWLAGGTCFPNTCPRPGSCCDPSGACTITFSSQCASGTWTLNGQCSPNSCPQPPTVTAIGSRYIAITPDSNQTLPVALRVTSPGFPCFEQYVTKNGQLFSLPLTMTPAEWGNVHIGDTGIVPNSSYTILAEGSAITAPVTVTTWHFGDTNNDQIIDLDDILCELAAFAGNFTPMCTLHSADQIGGFFNPDRIVNLDDIFAVLNAFAGQPYPGPYPCQ